MAIKQRVNKVKLTDVADLGTEKKINPPFNKNIHGGFILQLGYISVNLLNSLYFNVTILAFYCWDFHKSKICVRV